MGIAAVPYVSHLMELFPEPGIDSPGVGGARPAVFECHAGSELAGPVARAVTGRDALFDVHHARVRRTGYLPLRVQLQER